MLSPNELHAVVSSAPLVLFLLASIFAVFALFIKKPSFNVVLFIIISMACLSIYGAVYTGLAFKGQEEHYPAAVSKIFAHHESLSHKVLFTGIVTTAFSLIQMTLCFFRPGKLYKLVALLCLILCVITSLILIQVAKTGMSLVYEHGVGVHHTIQEKPPTPAVIETK